MLKPRIALVGCGKIARGHMRAMVEQVDRAEVISVVDIDASKARAFAEQYNIPHYYAGTDVLFQAQKPDLVVIVSPSGDHVQH